MKTECGKCEKIFSDKDLIVKQYIKVNCEGDISDNIEIKYCKKCYKIIKKEFDAEVESKVERMFGK